MDTEIKKMIATIFSVMMLCILIFMFIWSVVFVRYGDHVKYDPDIVITIQLGIGIACFFIILGFIFYVSMTNYAEYVSDKKVLALEAELERQKSRR